MTIQRVFIQFSVFFLSHLSLSLQSAHHRLFSPRNAHCQSVRWCSMVRQRSASISPTKSVQRNTLEGFSFQLSQPQVLKSISATLVFPWGNLGNFSGPSNPASSPQPNGWYYCDQSHRSNVRRHPLQGLCWALLIWHPTVFVASKNQEMSHSLHPWNRAFHKWGYPKWLVYKGKSH